jgi:asparagine synthase (glutamine-hydrolysing)
MCGIFTLLNNDNVFTQQFVDEQFMKGKNRGPEFSVLKNVMLHAQFGFHRLAINGLNTESNQPIQDGDIMLICNGEIYNYKELYQLMDVESATDSDCEVIIHLYKKYGIEQTLQLLDGVFSFVIIDFRLKLDTSKIYIARDPYGVRPLYILKPTVNIKDDPKNNMSNIIAVASELKELSEFYKVIKQKNDLIETSYLNTRMNVLDVNTITNTNSRHVIEQFTPGTYSEYILPSTVSAKWTLSKENVRYHTTGFISNIYDPVITEDSVLTNIQFYLKNAVYKRCSTTERPIACLLSGGLDSSLIAALVNQYHVTNGLATLETYSIGLAGSDDLYHAKIVADYLGTKHTEIVVTEEDFLNAIPEVIRTIESYDTTSVRASIGNWLLGKYISEHSEAKVIFNGDGSDELMGGYLYMYKAPDSIEFDKESRRLLKDIYMYDVLRSDKSISSHGLEPRTPFLDRSWVQYYLSIPVNMRNHRINKQCEKYLVRKAFSPEVYKDHNNGMLLPDLILWRKKEAFSDGVSKTSRSLYEIIQEYTDAMFEKDHKIKIREISNKEDFIKHLCEGCGIKEHLIPTTTEQYYYRKLFNKYYEGLDNILPYFWMPKYVDAKDASARTLTIYSNSNS